VEEETDVVGPLHPVEELPLELGEELHRVDGRVLRERGLERLAVVVADPHQRRDALLAALNDTLALDLEPGEPFERVAERQFPARDRAGDDVAVLDW
jgi:hypothetical protein